MKKLIVAVSTIVLCSLSVHSQMVNYTVQPNCAYKCSTSFFNNADSVFKTDVYNGKEYPCHWIMSAPGYVDSGVIYVHPLFNSDSTTRFPVYIRASEHGIPVACLFDKIWKIGTTIPLDSIWYGPYTLPIIQR